MNDEEDWVDVDDAGKSMEGSCESAEAGCCSHEAHTNTQAGTQSSLACTLRTLLAVPFPSLCLCSSTKLDRAQGAVMQQITLLDPGFTPLCCTSHLSRAYLDEYTMPAY